MLRGEVWRYQVGGMRERVVVLVSAQAVIDNVAYRVLYGVQVGDTDPGHVLAVSVILDDTPVWLDAAAGLMALRRSLLTNNSALSPQMRWLAWMLAWQQPSTTDPTRLRAIPIRTLHGRLVRDPQPTPLAVVVDGWHRCWAEWVAGSRPTCVV